MYNQCNFIGRLTNDPELRNVHTNSGDIPVCNFSIAVNDWRQPRVNNEPVAQFIRITVWREHAVQCHRYLAKGRAVACSGAISFYRQEVNGRVYDGMELQNANIVFLPDGRNNQNAPIATVAGNMAQSNAQVPVQPNYDAPPEIFNDATVVDDAQDLPF